MKLPVPPPVLPMLAKRVDALPDGEGWIYEPKWDGFRALVFRDGDELVLQSRDEKPLDRYFPELVDAAQGAAPGALRPRRRDRHRAPDGALDFEALQLRLHPAASRVEDARGADRRRRSSSGTCSATATATCARRRSASAARALEAPARRARRRRCTSRRRPPTARPPSDWFRRFEGAGLDGVMAKPAAGAYEPNKRAMLKVKHERDCDCVVGRLPLAQERRGQRRRLAAARPLRRRGRAAARRRLRELHRRQARRELVGFLAPYRENALDGPPVAASGPVWQGDAAHARVRKSRWSQGKDLSWEPLRPELVVEVAYDHMQGARFRHTAQFRRWRTDKPPSDCTYAQLEVVPPHELGAIFRT